MSKQCDVLVVGAGPAGCSTAFFLKHFDTENKLNVDLVERLIPDKYLKYHDICGEGIHNELFREIFPLKPKGVYQKIHSVNEHWPENILITSKINGHLLDRSLFLQSIIDEFKKIGGNYSIDKMLSFTQDMDKVKVKLGTKTKNYDYMVGADGPNSLIRGTLGLSAKKKLFIQYIVDKRPIEGVLDFYYDEKYKGDYLWEFPHENNVKIGFPVISKDNYVLKDKMLVSQSKYICYGGIQNYAVGRVLLVGDAAGQTNAFTKGGIRPSMNAGKMAAQAIINNNPKSYETLWRNSDFSSEIFLKIYNQFKVMSNQELVELIQPFRRFIPIYSTIKILLFYRKYLALYNGYNLANQVGW